MGEGRPLEVAHQDWSSKEKDSATRRWWVEEVHLQPVVAIF